MLTWFASIPPQWFPSQGETPWHITPVHDAFDVYLDELAPKLEHADRVSGFKDYCYGLMLSLPRKSIEPIAASVNPAHVQARHQALYHLIAKARCRIGRDD